MELIKLHPPFVHFAIALPLAMLIIELYYRINKRQPDGLHMIFAVLASLSVVAATLSGMIAYEPIEDKLYQIDTFKAHKNMGLIMAGYFLVLLGLRMSFSKASFVRTIYTIMLVLGVALLFFQGNMGGSVVYDHMVKPWVEGR